MAETSAEVAFLKDGKCYMLLEPEVPAAPSVAAIRKKTKQKDQSQQPPLKPRKRVWKKQQ